MIYPKRGLTKRKDSQSPPFGILEVPFVCPRDFSKLEALEREKVNGNYPRERTKGFCLGASPQTPVGNTVNSDHRLRVVGRI